MYACQKELPEKALISPEIAESLIGKCENTLIFDCACMGGNPEELFQQEHVKVKGSKHFQISRVTSKTETKARRVCHPLEFQEYARELGVKDNSVLVLYDHSEVKIAIYAATYTYWLFRLFGFKQPIYIVNGGLKAWKAYNPSIIVTDPSVPAQDPSQGTFTAGWEATILVPFSGLLEHVRSGNPNTLVLDARGEPFYTGRNVFTGAKLGGRIKGAKHLPSDLFLKEDGALLNHFQVEEKLKQAGLPVETLVTGVKIFTYCNSSHQSSALWFLLEQKGLKVANYDGSWLEWSHLAPPDACETEEK